MTSVSDMGHQKDWYRSAQYWHSPPSARKPFSPRYDPMTKSSDDQDPVRLDTLAVRAGQVRTGEGEHAEPIFTTSSFVFRNAAQAAARFAETEAGNIYSRFTNPTVRCFEERLAALEGGEACVATASGMGAILALCMTVLK